MVLGETMGFERILLDDDFDAAAASGEDDEWCEWH